MSDIVSLSFIEKHLLLGCGTLSSPKFPDFIAAKTFAGEVSLVGLDGRGGKGGTGGGEEICPKPELNPGLKPVMSVPCMRKVT